MSGYDAFNYIKAIFATVMSKQVETSETYETSEIFFCYYIFNNNVDKTPTFF